VTGSRYVKGDQTDHFSQVESRPGENHLNEFQVGKVRQHDCTTQYTTVSVYILMTTSRCAMTAH